MSAKGRPLDRVLQAVSVAALLGTIVPPVLFVAGRMELPAAQRWMALAALAWFAATPFWMDRERGA
jgi:hypothetical protein